MKAKTNRRKFVKTLFSGIGIGTLALFANVSHVHSAASNKKRWNILWITADDLNYDSLGYTGCKVPEITPHIDALAKKGMFFQHTHVTISVCVPCRTGLLTACYPHTFSPGYQNGKLQYRAKEGTPNLTQILQANGYFTSMLCKVKHHHVPEDHYQWDLAYTQRVEDFEKTGHGRDAQKLANSTKEAIKKSKEAGKPFFLKVNINDPHRPFPGSEREKKMSDNPGSSYGWLSKTPRPSRTYSPVEVEVPDFLPDTPEVREKIAQYFGGVKRCDDSVGAVYNALVETGEEENTIVLFLSDHGMPFPFAKENCYWHSTRSPMFVIWPGVTKPGSVDSRHMINSVDVTPTILDILGLPQMEGADGRSFKPLLIGVPQAHRETVVTVFHHTPGQKHSYEMRSINNTRYGYIYNAWADGDLKYEAGDPDNGPTMDAIIELAKTDPKWKERLDFYYYRTSEELYDYENDPDALHNLIDDPGHQQIATSLRSELLQWMEKNDDPLKSEFKQLYGINKK